MVTADNQPYGVAWIDDATRDQDRSKADGMIRRQYRSRAIGLDSKPMAWHTYNVWVLSNAVYDRLIAYWQYAGKPAPWNGISTVLGWEYEAIPNEGKVHVNG